ncbi:NAD-dependent epimerase/dehydratase family protein [Pseudomonadales bacterium]|nr:NAD-dependent epimerase/dehydratase family protein [Pseudomonadales bacterium]
MAEREKNKILVTGANGFVGEALSRELHTSGYDILCSVRDRSRTVAVGKQIIVDSLDSHTQWRQALKGCSTVIHLAGRAHVLNDNVTDPLATFRAINTSGTLNLAEQAAASGVSRFIFLSSIGVNGGETAGLPFNTYDAPHPHSAYAISKLEAEIGLLEIAKRTNLDVVIIRSPAIYGKNAPGNFGLIERFIKYGIPLPVGSIDNKRSLVAIKNLVSFITLCIEHQKAANGLFFVSDNEDLSTLEVVKLMGALVGKKPSIIKCPLICLRFIFKVLGKQKAGESLMSNLQLDSDRSGELLGWSPPFSPKKLIKSLG